VLGRVHLRDDIIDAGRDAAAPVKVALGVRAADGSHVADDVRVRRQQLVGADADERAVLPSCSGKHLVVAAAQGAGELPPHGPAGGGGARDVP
jgi:hypothetical protein